MQRANTAVHEFTILDLTDYGHNLLTEHLATIKHLCNCDISVSQIGRASATLYSTDQATINRFEDIIGSINVKAYEIVGYSMPEEYSLKF